MKQQPTICSHWLIGLIVSLLGCFVPALPAQEALQQGSWQQAETAVFKSQVLAWMQQLQPSSETQTALEKLWQKEETTPAQLTELVHASCSRLDPAAAQFLEQVTNLKSIIQPNQIPTYANASAPEWVKQHLQFTLAITLTQLNLYDEAALHFKELTPTQVCDPASLLFYRSVVEHKLLQKEACLETLEQLLENKERVPPRYATVASLMQADLEPVEPDSLEEISRLMDDVRRRLDLGRAGKKVREEEAEIIAKLDKKIEDLEKKRKQQQQQAQQSKNSPKPAEKSKIQGDLQATDEVDLKRFSKAAQWGNLPPKQRQQALQQLGRDLPAHFRDIIEEYFKRLAQDGNQ